MSIIRLGRSDFDEMFAMWASWDTYQGLPKAATFYNWPNINEMWKNHHFLNIQRDEAFYFGIRENGTLMGFVQYDTFLMNNDIPSAALGTVSTNRAVQLAKTYGQRFYPDIVFDMTNHAIGLFDEMGVDDFYHLSRGARSENFVALGDCPQSLLSKYTKTLVEHVKPGKNPTDPYMRGFVLKTSRSTAQDIYCYSKAE